MRRFAKLLLSVSVAASLPAYADAPKVDPQDLVNPMAQNQTSVSAEGEGLLARTKILVDDVKAGKPAEAHAIT